MRDQRSLLNFAVLIIVATATTLFILEKAEGAIAEIRELQSTPVYLGKKVIEEPQSIK